MERTITKEQYIIEKMAVEIAQLKSANYELEFNVLALQQKNEQLEEELKDKKEKEKAECKDCK